MYREKKFYTYSVKHSRLLFLMIGFTLIFGCVSHLGKYTRYRSIARKNKVIFNDTTSKDFFAEKKVSKWKLTYEQSHDLDRKTYLFLIEALEKTSVAD